MGDIVLKLWVPRKALMATSDFHLHHLSLDLPILRGELRINSALVNQPCNKFDGISKPFWKNHNRSSNLEYYQIK